MRIKLCDQYKTEREEICKKLIAIVGTEFYLSDLDEDIEKQNTILALKEEIQKVFAVSTISSFKPCLVNDVKRDALNFLQTFIDNFPIWTDSLKQRVWRVRVSKNKLYCKISIFKSFKRAGRAGRAILKPPIKCLPQ